MFDDSAHTLAWARRLLTERIRPAIHRGQRPLRVRAWVPPLTATDDPPDVAEAVGAEYTPIPVGSAWGAPWTTTWFEVTGEVPNEFAGERVEVCIDLGFVGSGPGFQAEGLLYDEAGTPLKGIHPANRWYPVTPSASGGENVRLYLEAAANPTILDTFAPTSLGDPTTCGTDPQYRLGRVDVAIFDHEVFGLAMDLDVLLDLAEQLPTGDARRREVLAAVSDALDLLDVADVTGTASAVRTGLAATLAAPAVASAHELTAVAHAHIDSAWLWPVRETKRKCARTFANVTALAQDYPELTFACSSAQQYRWIRDGQPAIWQRIVAAVQAGSWEPVGGMWVEPDGMIPSGESLARQLLFGQSFFRAEFGEICSGMWLPDSFGYNAGYPQIAALAGARWFLTQKISWNDTNTFPHHTFWWEGIDGTRILTHFPPADTYNADLGGADLHRSAQQHRERGRSRKALIPFGFGDGGGGPEREMLERARRVGSLEGSPRVQVGRAETFFDDLRAEYGAAAPVWVGELYLELHRGTFTSQRAMKVGNRHCEGALRAAELVWSLVAVHRLGDYPAAELRELWERVLLLQFHDILPGSSIAWVHQEARADYARIVVALDGLIAAGLARLAASAALEAARPIVLNAAPFARREPVDFSDGVALVAVEASRVAAARRVRPEHPVAVLSTDEEPTRIGNGLVSVELAPDGSIASLIDHRHGDRQVLASGRTGAELRLHPDVPLQWDAWDLDARHARTWRSAEAGTTTLAQVGELRVVAETRTRIGASPLLVRVTVTADSPRVDVEVEIDWRDREATLAAYLPVAVLARESRADIQFGHLARPTHENTSWDAARFEQVAHRWLHVGENGWGTAVVNDGVYGHSARHDRGDDGAPATTIRLTLLRAAGFPDPAADAGAHSIRFGIVPGADLAEAIEHGYRVNLPLRVAGPAEPADASGVADDLTAVTVDDPGCVLEVVKLAEDARPGQTGDDERPDVVIRLYEALGGTREVTLTPGFAVAEVVETDLLEQHDSPALDGRRALVSVDPIRLRLRPFQLVTLRLTPH